MDIYEPTEGLKMNVLEQIANNKVLIFSGLSWLVAQIIKMIGVLITEKRFDAERIFGNGGMPSAHSATVCCLTVLVGWVSVGQYASLEFAICVILSIIVMNDATGVRLEAGKHAASIKELATAVNGLFTEKDKKIKTEKLKLLVGHTPLQVLFGAILGIAMALIAIFFFI